MNTIFIYILATYTRIIGSHIKKKPRGTRGNSGAPYARKLEPVYARNHPNRPDNTEIRDFGIIAKGGLILAYRPDFPCLIPQQGLEQG